ncbi:sensor histidine kinase [Faunimonas sp. B44]|uniref:sensor histidine kinase n=1 Tax=Faunimonas sp. B44 TaxID=3461493 RepID=UPI004043D35E
MSVAIEDGVRLARPGVQHRPAPAAGTGCTARCNSHALAMTGIVALLGLPFLLIASLATEAPIALPAAVAVGYLAVAQALDRGRHRLADRLARAITVALLAAAALLLANLAANPTVASAFALLLALAFPAVPPIMASAFGHGHTGVPEAAPAAVRDAGDPGVEPSVVRSCDEAARIAAPRFGCEANARPPAPGAAAEGEGPARRSSDATLPLLDTDVVEAARFVLRLLEREAVERGLALRLRAPLAAHASCGVRACRQILINLVGSAIRQAEGATCISLDIRPSRGAVLLRVTDDGIRPGHDEHGTVAGPHGCGALARDRLGLAILEEVVDENGGSLLISNARGSGPAVEVRLPAASAARLARPDLRLT